MIPLYSNTFCYHLTRNVSEKFNKDKKERQKLEGTQIVLSCIKLFQVAEHLTNIINVNDKQSKLEPKMGFASHRCSKKWSEVYFH